MRLAGELSDVIDYVSTVEGMGVGEIMFSFRMTADNFADVLRHGAAVFGMGG